MLDILASLYHLNATALQDDSFQVVLFILLLLFLKDILPVWKPVLCQKLISGFGYLPKSERFYLNFKDEIRLRLDK